MRVHFIAIGGSAMHNLAIALCKKGYQVTGSDDEIFEPAKSRLERYGLLPKTIGWNPDLIDENINAVILGMHAKEDNPELIKAKQLGLKIYSYPEYLYEISSSKIRVVVGGSHGKTSITAMILHALQALNVKTDYMVGAMLEGFEVMVKVEDDSKYMVLEGDEYLSSTLDRRPKFHLYKPDIAIINGIAWDHINVFPTFENYVEQFKIFADKIENGGRLIYFDGDENIRNIAANVRNDIKTMPYNGLNFRVENGKTIVLNGDKEYPMLVFGRHNMINMNAAMLACESLGINRDSFLETMQSFKGAAKRLELLASNDTKAIYTDFAHSPSKLKATIEAVKEQYPNRKLVACMELHTFSSLSKNFLEQYKGCMNKADKALVYYNHHAIELKRLEELSIELVEKAFDKEGLKVTTDSSEFVQFVKQNAEDNTNILIMSSGNFGGVNIKQLAEEVI
ncbi:MAG: Mur ligase family protein [Bacteroidales bacterium]|jgi:UDP-N-acetylmuramate: L-alanyl-gamma-D-glutamyl-meso-diaminopimelate ligase|nr:Mur ligase family protein [Bacteroidales bacterium]